MVAAISQQVYCVGWNMDKDPDSSVVSNLLPDSLRFSEYTEDLFTD